MAYFNAAPTSVCPQSRRQSIPTPATTAGIRRPALTLLGSEPWRAARELVAHAFNRAQSCAAGDGHPVIVFPGLGASGISVTPLREHCLALGYAAFDWGQGYNRGPVGDFDDWLSVLAARIEEVLEPFSQSATLIGWSLGGLYARELAKRIVPRVRQVITFGTPFNADADHTNVGWLFRLLSGNAARLDPETRARLRQPPPVPTTSIYSRADGVVAWQTCRHPESAAFVEDIEIVGSHVGMGWNPVVLDVVADRLAQAPGRWRPYADYRPSAPM